MLVGSLWVARQAGGDLRIVAPGEQVRAVLDRVGAEPPEIPASDLMQFETAVIEIATNVVEYGRPAGQVRWRLTLRPRHGEIRAALDDSGQEFEPDLDSGMPDELAEGGRGLPLARALLDEIAFQRDAGGNHWLMVRRLNREPA